MTEEIKIADGCATIDDEDEGTFEYCPYISVEYIRSLGDDELVDGFLYWTHEASSYDDMSYVCAYNARMFTDEILRRWMPVSSYYAIFTPDGNLDHVIKAPSMLDAKDLWAEEDGECDFSRDEMTIDKIDMQLIRLLVFSDQCLQYACRCGPVSSISNCEKRMSCAATRALR
ncbi:hypothetical protein DWF04_015310 [Cereibacter sphaeroides f. sp. denitrificans]|nr:hypothetical protein DWF04_16600 [Cereibacter sphaeroides f. sp. denitrificans]